jgi:peptidoglycan/LPS O-acetylase OafA/YrhL
MNNNRLLELDALRGLAALAVVFFHYFYRYDEIYGHSELAVNWVYYGSLGVELFFIVSGFVIFWTLNRIEKPFDFIVSRFSRLYPVYWAALIITFISVLIFELPGRDVSFFDAFLNGLMFHEYLWIPHVDGVYWTLTVELTFYFWMFVLFLTKMLERVGWLLLFLMTFSVLESLDFIQVNDILYKILILKYISFFAAGISFYNIINEKQLKLSIFVLIVSLLTTIATFSLVHFYITTLIYAVFYLSVTGKVKGLSSKPLIYIGGLSYSLYLIHQNVGYIIINKFYENGFNPVLGIFSALIISLIIASILTKYVEKPSLLFIRDRYKNNTALQLRMSHLFFFSKGE